MKAIFETSVSESLRDIKREYSMLTFAANEFLKLFFCHL